MIIILSVLLLFVSLLLSLSFLLLSLVLLSCLLYKRAGGGFREPLVEPDSSLCKYDLCCYTYIHVYIYIYMFCVCCVIVGFICCYLYLCLGYVDVSCCS